MKTIIKKAGWLVCVGLAVVLGTGCKTIVRENIISAIDTGVGATIAENKQTQLYELKAGYIRSQFYSIPTGKIVENSSTNNAMISGTNGTSVNAQISNAANVTPQLVAGIKSHTGLGDILLGMDVSENFAVGDIAVMSPAATAMYVANAEKPGNATAAAEAVKNVGQNNYSKYVEGTYLAGDATKKLRNWLVDANGNYVPANQKALQTWMAANNLAGLDIAPFLNLKQFADDRLRAANDLVK